jgi:uncharacterized lipoprotein YddW (UPF0748 family)
MNRRVFLKSAALSAAAMVTHSLHAHSRDPGIKNWVWIPINTKKSADDWKSCFALMRESGIRAIVPEIFNGTYAYFASQHLPVRIDLLGMMLPLALAEGLEVHAWMWCMPCMVAEVMKQHPDWYDVNAKGESALDKPAYVSHYTFLDPGRPEVREWLQQTVKELANIAELTGVHFDYIRYPDAILARGLRKNYSIVQDKVYPQYDYGYSEYERNLFHKKFGIDPLKIPDPTHHKKWMKFRFDTVTDLVNRYLVPPARAKGKQITAAVFPGPTLAREMVRQDWGRWHLDAFLPMLYNSFYEEGPEWVRQQTREAVSTVKKPVYSGLFVAPMDEGGFTETVEMSLEGGASGISIFAMESMNEAKWKTLRKITEARSRKHVGSAALY